MAEKETKLDGLTIKWIGHSTVQIKDTKGRVIYIDPFSKVLKGDEEKADLIVSTHPHFDHFDPGAIERLCKPGTETEVVAKKGCELGRVKAAKGRELDVGQAVEVRGVKIKAVQAYNLRRFRSPGQPFHPKGLGMGVLLELEGKRLYYAGDTDFIPEMEGLKAEGLDLAFLPIGGTYTMDGPEAAEAARAISPKIVVPTHYNLLPETRADPEEFKEKLAGTGIEVRIL
ncbi:TPA: MBL fold metallo-hydrolase [Candidatus Bipolaricaulota bacterium]|nr:MBL fold metallo-hydrolase [Candidatus Bipolaricaulota bacterium]